MKRAVGPVALVVLDGWGLRDEREGNAVALARTPCFDTLWCDYPHARLLAHGEHVGLTPGQIGNSNVGHLNLGAGRVVYQALVRVDRAVVSGALKENDVLRDAMATARDGTLHLMGLFSDGGVHSHIRHLLALLEMADHLAVERVAIHCFLDGRDVPPQSARRYFDALVEARGAGALDQVATVMGRYYAMDRDHRWERTRAAYDALVQGHGRTAVGPLEALEDAYAAGVTDEFVEPAVMVDAAGRPRALVRAGDAVVFFNFRADRGRQLVRALVDEDFDAFPRPGDSKLARRLQLVTMTEYDETLPVPVAFGREDLRNTFGEVVAAHGLTQLRIAETEQYAHVTSVFPGGEDTPVPGEERVLVPSPRVATYDLKPEMSAGEVTGRLVGLLQERHFDAIILNYANPDMVGHTGVLEAAVEACEVVDRCLRRTVEAVLARDGALLVVADHGNAELMIDPESGGPHTAHTLSPVPAILVKEDAGGWALRDGILADVAPTLLELMELPAPPEMTRHSLIRRRPTGAREGNSREQDSIRRCLGDP